MEKQNVTLSLPKETLRKARLLAVERNTSLSSLLVEIIEEIVAKADAYELAKERQLALMNQGFNLGTGGKATWTRDELHER
ncbi:MAG: CopG family transcriptional regulator [Chloroflexi bacterium]|nr:CopG family transcriptional regulator [Ardenticatenaceae bacterium]MBL1129307.1 CopG family transcriptional regulator [Chloroflexota bacterium]NOG35383.1 CopG family transcriptional regulator [Chloroflexota bacterium]GIK58613.1 MAG: CopG family transcriptional regulator [Chloroflexota bacterium]